MSQAQSNRRKHKLTPSQVSTLHHARGTAGARAPEHHRKDRRGCWADPPLPALSLLGRARWKLGWVLVTPEARSCFHSFFHPKKFPSWMFHLVPPPLPLPKSQKSSSWGIASPATATGMRAQGSLPNPPRL